MCPVDADGMSESVSLCDSDSSLAASSEADDGSSSSAASSGTYHERVVKNEWWALQRGPSIRVLHYVRYTPGTSTFSRPYIGANLRGEEHSPRLLPVSQGRTCVWAWCIAITAGTAFASS